MFAYEVLDKCPHPDLASWVIGHLVLVGAILAVRRTWPRSGFVVLLAAGFASALSSAALWLFLGGSNSIACELRAAVGPTYLVLAGMASFAPLVAAVVASRIKVSSASP